MNKNRKLTASIVAALALVVAIPHQVDAVIQPTLSVVPSCEGLTVKAMYFQQPRTVRVNNQITVTVDGVSQVRDFGATLYPAIVVPWNPGTEHSYTVIVDANRVMGLPAAYDKLVEGVQPACVS